MKVLKRNQLIVLVISLMLITAGYLNFTSNQENIMTSTIADRSDTAIGDAELVSTIPHEENVIEQNNVNAVIENKIEEGVTQEKTKEAASDITNEAEIVQTSTEDYYFTTAKLERNTMYSESLETYQEIYNNTNATAEAKAEAFSKINKINNTKNAIMIAENLIIAKEFEDVVIFSNEGSVSVIIKSKELKQVKSKIIFLIFFNKSPKILKLFETNSILLI